MPDIWMDVDAALTEVPVNILPLVDDTDFKTIEAAVVYNSAGMALFWNFENTAGVNTKTAVTPTTSGVYDWSGDGTDPDGMYTIEIPASGGASANNDSEGTGWFTGVATGVLPWRGPTIGFRAAALNNSLIDGATIDVRLLGNVTHGDSDAKLVLNDFDISRSDAGPAINIDAANGIGIDINSTSHGIEIESSAASGVVIGSSGGNGNGVVMYGNGSGDGLDITGGTTGVGIEIEGSPGIEVKSTAGYGWGIEIYGDDGGAAVYIQGSQGGGDNADAVELVGSGTGVEVNSAAHGTDERILISANAQALPNVDVAIGVGGIPVGAFAANSITDAALAADAETAIATAVNDIVIESNGNITRQQAESIMLSALAGVTATDGTILKDPSGANNRVVATINANNERTTMNLTPST